MSSAAGGAAASSSNSSASGTAASGSSGGSTSAGSGTTAGNPPPSNPGAVTINWMPPTENTDGTPLTNLAGYNIHYGTTSGSYTQTVAVANPGIATFVVQSLSPGTYYFTVAAVNASGTESPLSAEVSATVN